VNIDRPRRSIMNGAGPGHPTILGLIVTSSALIFPEWIIMLPQVAATLCSVGALPSPKRSCTTKACAGKKVAPVLFLY
jgi:hypothetical protein